MISFFGGSMKNNFALSFGFSLVLIGGICIFVKISYIVMAGVALSAFVFSFINIILAMKKNKKNELIYAIPFFILLLFCCFGDSLIKIEDFNKEISINATNAITFMSFGFIFLAEYINKKNEVKLEKDKYSKLVDETLEYTELALNIITNSYKCCTYKYLLNSFN